MQVSTNPFQRRFHSIAAKLSSLKELTAVKQHVKQPYPGPLSRYEEQSEFSDQPTAAPYSVIALVGLPRSGTTLVHRMLSMHSQVDGIIEPYQQGRDTDYAKTNIFKLCSDFEIEPCPEKAILVKETATREINVIRTLDLLENARNHHLYTGLIVLFRSPFEAYLSHVEASSKWLKSNPLVINQKTFTHFANDTLQSLDHIVRRARTQHYRLVSYRTLCADVENEIARLMAVFPLRYEHQQTTLQSRIPKGGGDPKAHASNTITFSDRSADVTKLLIQLKDTPLRRKMQAYHRFCQQFETMSETDALDWLSDIVIMRQY